MHHELLPRSIENNRNSVKISNHAKEIDILLRLLPYFEVQMNMKQSEGAESRDLRKLLGIAKSEADMIQR